MSNDRYVSPLSERYASKEMQYIFSPDKKFRTWRKLWIALAETEKELGLHITDEQIAELKEHADDINFDVAKEREKVVRHDVMSEGKRNHPSWSNFLLCRGQFGYYYHGRGTEVGPYEADQCDCRTGKIRRCTESPANTCIYPFPAGTADNCRKKSDAVAAGV